MRKKVKKGLIISLMFAAIGMGACIVLGSIPSGEARDRMEEHASMALEYCKKQGLSTDRCFLVDFDIHSGKKRFFVWDFHKKRVVFATICAHGRGKNSTRSFPAISNEPGSKCSSVGRFKVGIYRKMNRIPLIPCYELSGLDSSCSNAMARGILIHPTLCAQLPTWPIPMLHMTSGCFGMSFLGMHKVKYFSENTDRPILLWAYK